MGFWACLGDLPPDMPRRPETWVSLCNLRLKLRGISRSSAIIGSDSPQSNNRKDNCLWVTPFIPLQRPNVKHAIAGYFEATTAYTSASTDARAALAPQLSGETRVPTGNPPEDYGQIRGGCNYVGLLVTLLASTISSIIFGDTTMSGVPENHTVALCTKIIDVSRFQ